MPTPSQIQQAADILAKGGLVAFPTETVYGLGADAENPQAVAKIYQAKGRPANHPVIVHIASEANLAYWVKEIPQEAYKLIAAFWPGPLTLILKRADHIPDTVAGGQTNIGIRCPSHPVAQALLSAFKNGRGGIAAPSANKFGHISPTTAQHVRDEFAADLQSGLVQMVLEDEQSEIGIESAIVDLTRLETHGPVLLRPGQICIDQLAKVLGTTLTTPDEVGDNDGTPRASGTLAAHYAPHTPVAIIPTDQLVTTLERLHNVNKTAAVLHYSKLTTPYRGSTVQLPTHPAKFAHQLYASLRLLDTVYANIILVEALPNTTEWQGVRDRLQRAAHDSTGVLAKLLTP